MEKQKCLRLSKRHAVKPSCVCLEPDEFRRVIYTTELKKLSKDFRRYLYLNVSELSSFVAEHRAGLYFEGCHR